MKDIFLSKSINFIIKNDKHYSDKEIEKIKYGLEGLYLTITKLIIVLITASILNILKEVILTLIFFNIIRFTAFGVHAEKSNICLITSLVLVIGLTLLMKNLTLSFNTKSMLCGILLLDYCFFAPADTVKRPLTNSKKRKVRKISSILIAIIFTVLILTIDNELSNIILTALVIEGMMINPIMYKLLKTPFDNYKKLV